MTIITTYWVSTFTCCCLPMYPIAIVSMLPQFKRYRIEKYDLCWPESCTKTFHCDSDRLPVALLAISFLNLGSYCIQESRIVLARFFDIWQITMQHSALGFPFTSSASRHFLNTCVVCSFDNPCHCLSRFLIQPN